VRLNTPRTRVGTVVVFKEFKKFPYECSVKNIVLFYHVHCSVHFPAYFCTSYFSRQFSVSHKIV
jgi:hypothetical protein